MVSAGDFRNGVTFDMDGNVYQIIEFQHVKPGKGAAFVRTKIRNVITGAVTERTFNPSDKYPTAYIERKDMEYLYSDGDLYYFMDQETYENIPINKSILSDNFKFVKENTVCKILSYKGSVNWVRTATPLCFPGFHLGMLMMTLIASLSKYSSTPWAIFGLEILPSFSIMNRTDTIP